MSFIVCHFVKALIIYFSVMRALLSHGFRNTQITIIGFMQKMVIDFVRHESNVMAYQTLHKEIDKCFNNSMCSKDLGSKRITVAFLV